MNRFFLFAAAVLLCGACTKVEDGDIHNTIPASQKIINSPEGAASGIIMTRLAADVEHFDLNSVAGIEVDVKPMFPNSEGTSLEQWMLISFDPEVELRTIAKGLAEDSRVEIVEYDQPVKRIKANKVPMPTTRPALTRSIEMPFDDPELPWQWNYHNTGTIVGYEPGEYTMLPGADINLFEAWKYTTGDNRVVVAVIDGGIQVDHDDLASNMWVNEAEANGSLGIDDDMNGYVDDIYGYNFVTNSGKIRADSHGTHVAGTISAVNNNGYAVCGIAGGSGNNDGVRLMSLQIFDGDDGCYSYQIAQAFKYAADNGAAIVNNSWAYDPYGFASDDEYVQYDGALKAAIDYFEENGGMDGVMEGGLAIFAASNEAANVASYPGAYHAYTCVTAMSPDYTAAYYTNYGPGCNICAPGGDANYGTLCTISSTSDSRYGYEYMQGTSMACPHVTGCLALGLSYAVQNGYSFTNDEMRNMLLTSVHDIDKYQVGSKSAFDLESGEYYDLQLEPYQGNLGTGYIDAHLLLMQIANTPCLYFTAGEETLCSLDEFFGDASQSLTYLGVDISDEAREAVGMVDTPTIENGKLKIKCTKRGTARITVRAIAGGENLGGGNAIGGMEIAREFEIVVRQSTAKNGGWL